jgi:hypothetical protein
MIAGLQVIALVLLSSCAAGCGSRGRTNQQPDARDTRSDSGSAGSDSGTSSDSGSSAGTCGGKTCYAGQSCVSGECSFTACSGSHVPGDYATIQAAINALTNGGGSGTICLAAQTYTENLSLITGRVTIEGVSPSQSSISALQMTYAFEGNVGVSLMGLSITSVSIQPSANPGNGTASFTACSIGTIAIGGGLEPGGVSIAASLDGVDLSSGSAASPALSVSFPDVGDGGSGGF